MFTNWLSKTKALQEQAFGTDYDQLHSNPDKLADYFLTQLFATHDEISEVAQEIVWKPWAQNRGQFHREAVRDEVIDALHFLANILVAAGIDDEELRLFYEEKMAINRARQEDGYEQRGFTSTNVVE